MDAVGADQQAAALFASPLAAPLVGEGGDNAGPLLAPLLLAPVRQGPPGQDFPAADAGLPRGQQQHPQLAAGGRDLRPGVAGVLAAWLRPDELAALGVVGDTTGSQAVTFANGAH